MKNKEELKAFKIAKDTIENRVDDPTSKLEKELIAKKDHIIVHNEYKIVIKKGEPIKDLPKMFIATLRTEKVI